jgi:hypothetical protein
MFQSGKHRRCCELAHREAKPHGVHVMERDHLSDG